VRQYTLITKAKIECLCWH